MHAFSLTRAAGALLAGLVFVTANTASVVCAAVHHSQHASAPDAGHHDHGQAQAPAQSAGPAIAGSHAVPPGCVDMSHCGVGVTGVTTAVVVLRVATPHGFAAPLSGAASPHAATFSPPTPPPRA